MLGSPMPKHCPRCRGLMLLESDGWGPFGCCVSCGYNWEFQETTPEEILSEDEQRKAGKQRARHPSHGGIDLG